MVVDWRELIDHPEFVAILRENDQGLERFLVASDWAQEREGFEGPLTLACRLAGAFGRGVKFGRRLYWAESGVFRPDRGPLDWSITWVGVGTGRKRWTAAFRNRRRCCSTDSKTGGGTFEALVCEAEQLLAIQERERTAKQTEADERKRLVAEWVNPVKVGDLFVHEWGYDQTNVDFAEVVKVGPRSVTLQRIAKHYTTESHRVVPVKGLFLTSFKANVVRFSFTVRQGRLSWRLPVKHHKGSWHQTTPEKSYYQDYWGR